MIQVFCGSHQKPQYMAATINQVVRSSNLLTVTSWERLPFPLLTPVVNNYLIKMSWKPFIQLLHLGLSSKAARS